MENLLTGFQVDDLYRWPKGRAEKLARRGSLPHLILPDGKTIRFDRAEVEALVKRVPATPADKITKNGGAV